MIIVQPKVTIEQISTMHQALLRIEKYTRKAYKSEEKVVL
jgi:hypothetical protein